MKKTMIVFAVTSLALQIAHAQGTMTYLSNLRQSSAGSLSVGSDSWLAADFRTGTNAGGYLLDSVELVMTGALGNPNAFRVMLYDNGAYPIGFSPGTSLGSLVGSSSPTMADIYNFTPTSGITLSPRTVYFIVLTAGTTVADGAYEWCYAITSSYNPSGGWGGGLAFGSSNGSLNSWNVLGAHPQYYYPQYAINATPVPEPSVFGLLMLVGLGVLWHRWKHC